jgi:hypothetical protein
VFGLGFSPDTYVSAEKILKHPEFIDFTPDEKFALYWYEGDMRLNLDSITFDNSVLWMRRQYLTHNISQYQGLLASRILKAPLKIDIFLNGMVTSGGVCDTLVSLGLEQDEINDVLALMLASYLAHYTGIRKLWHLFGYR